MVCYNFTEELLDIFERLVHLSSTLEGIFDTGNCILWIVANVTSRQKRGELVEAILVKTCSTAPGLLPLKSLVKKLKKSSESCSTDSLQANIHLLTSLRKVCYFMSSDRVDSSPPIIQYFFFFFFWYKSSTKSDSGYDSENCFSELCINSP